MAFDLEQPLLDRFFISFSVMNPLSITSNKIKRLYFLSNYLFKIS